MAMATVASPPALKAEQRVALPSVSWKTYERLLADDEECRVPRLTYDRGMLELVSPSMPPEEDAQTIILLVDIVAATLGVPIRSVGSTTVKRRDLQRGFEPDASFYVQNEARIRGQEAVDLAVDPPPDVVLEMEVGRSALDKLGLFAAMGIPEVWRCDGRRLRIFVLAGASYRETGASLALPVVTSDALARFLAERRTRLSPDWFQMVGDWVLAQRAVLTLRRSRA